MNERTRRRRRVFVATCIGVAASILAVWLSVTLIVLAMYERLSEASQLGDTYGVVNSLFSALAFGGIILTIYLQSHELRLQRKELRLQRAESKQQRIQLQKAAEAQEKSQAALREQVEWQSLTAYLQALLILREADPQQQAGIDELIEGIARYAVPGIIPKVLRSLSEARQQQAEFQKRNIAACINDHLTPLRDLLAGHNYSERALNDALNRLYRLHTSLTVILESVKTPDDTSFAMTNQAREQMYELIQSPISTPSDQEQAGEFWRRLSNIVDYLGSLLKLLSSAGDDAPPSNPPDSAPGDSIRNT